MNEERLSKIELALERLTTINEVQTDQMKVLLKNGGIMLSLSKSSEQHSRNIVDLFNMMHDHERRMEKYRHEVNKDLTDTRTSLNKASWSRFMIAISVMSTVGFTLFSINSSAIKNSYDRNRDYINKLDATRTMMISRMGIVEEKLSHCYGNGQWDQKKFDKIKGK